MNLIKVAGLWNIVVGISSCFEKLVNEFIDNLSSECNNEGSQEFMRVYVRGKCVRFSLIVINEYLERSTSARTEKVSLIK